MIAQSRPLAWLLALAGFFLACAAVRANEIRAISLYAESTGTRAEIHLAAAGEYRMMTLTGPDRLVVDFPDSRAKEKLSLPAAAGVVSTVRTGEPVPGTLRVVFDLTQPAVAARPQIHQADDNHNDARLIIQWPSTAVSSSSTAVAQTPSASTPTVSVATNSEQAKQEAARALALLTASNNTAEPATPNTAASPELTTTPSRPAPATPVAPPTATNAAIVPVSMQPGMRPLIIAIDAGHGGKDPGAINRSTGTQEKHVALAIARELARQVDATPGLRAYLTRNSDVFIELPARSRMARAAHADMFISIHANASKNNLAARGASVHLLSTRGASSQYARWLANEENAADLIGGIRPRSDDVVTNVLLSLAQSGTMKASQDAGNHVLEQLRQVGRIHSQNLEYANLSVLRNADMPAMLVETGFLSNREDERLLVSAAYQRRVANAILQGVITFFSRQPPPGTLFAARAQAETKTSR